MSNKLFLLSLIAVSLFITSCNSSSDRQKEVDGRQQLKEKGFGGEGADPSSGTVVSDDSSAAPVQGTNDDTTSSNTIH